MRINVACGCKEYLQVLPKCFRMVDDASTHCSAQDAMDIALRRKSVVTCASLGLLSHISGRAFDNTVIIVAKASRRHTTGNDRGD